MKQLSLLILLMFTLTGNSFAQLGKLVFEDAEKAYSEGKFEEALKLLDEAEKTLGKTNAPIQHLRIISGAEVIKKDPYKDFDIIARTRKETNLFLDKYGDEERLAVKYRQVYEVSKLLKNLPLSRQQFTDENAARKAKALNDEQVKKEKLKRFLTYSYIPDFKKGVPLETIVNTFPRSVRKKLVSIDDEGNKNVWSSLGCNTLFHNDKSAGYSKREVVKSADDAHGAGRAVLNEKRAFFTDLFGFEPVETTAKYADAATKGGSYIWTSGNKTFKVKYIFLYYVNEYRTHITYYDIDKS